jgi:uncharacterized protein
MVSDRPSDATVRLARHLGLKAPVLQALQNGLERGEYPVYLRAAAPRLAGQFPHAFGFEVLLERLRRGESVERRRANLERLLEGREGELDAAAKEVLETTMDEGQLDDLSAMIHGMPRAAKPAVEGEESSSEEAPAEEAASEEPAADADPQQAFLNRLQQDPSFSGQVQQCFLQHGTVAVVARGEGDELKRFASLLHEPRPMNSLDAGNYLHLRRGEKAHALSLVFDLPAKELLALFDRVGGYPVQEKEKYRVIFQDAVRETMLPKMVQRMRANWKQLGEDLALQQGWEHVERGLDRGQHDGPVLGVSRGRRGRLILALMAARDQAPTVLELDPKAEDLAQSVSTFLGEARPAVVGLQADSATRNSVQKVTKAVEGWKPRLAMVPLAVVKTMLREVARRPFEALLGHEERQAFLTAELVQNPRAAAFHTPHIVRAFVTNRGEINPRLLDEFETTFLRSLLAARGADANTASMHVLSLVPGLDAYAAVAERSTAPYRSLEDLRERLGLSGPAWNAAACLLRVRGGDEPLDAKALHPQYYSPLRNALAASEMSLGDLIKEPGKANQLDWSFLEDERERQGTIQRVRDGLGKAKRGRMRAPGASSRGRSLETLRVGESFQGTVRSLADYGAFVDIGAERDGLVHVSHCAPRFLKHPSEALEEGQEVEVRVLEVDLGKRKIRLSALSEADEAAREAERKERAANRGGNRGQGGGGRGGPGGGKGGRGGGRRDGRSGGRGRREDFGPDPRAKKEEFDPTNPFYVFFQQQQEQEKQGNSEAKSKD